jgi:FKBP-type peptidyl-prolyl cis-trans isomerase
MSHIKKKLFLLLPLLAIFAFCSFESQAQTSRKRITAGHRKILKKTSSKRRPFTRPTGAIKTVSGLTYVVTHKGSGRRPKKGETVIVHYTGTLTDGTKFDSSRDRGQPFSSPLGAGRVIKGWDEGIARMRVGEQAILIIPPSLGYGKRGAGAVIPPDAKLIFVVELVDIKQ